MCIANSNDRRLIAAMAQQIVDLTDAYQDAEKRAEANYSATFQTERRLSTERDSRADTRIQLERAQKELADARDTLDQLMDERDQLRAEKTRLTDLLRNFIETYDDEYSGTELLDALSPTIGLARQALESHAAAATPAPGLEADVPF